jgi:mono/diheme cytochrome c family protein
MNAWTLLAGATIIVAAAGATTGAPMSPQPYSGKSDYQVYCASCHGAEARGDGVIAKSLKKPPADLTLLTKRHDGIFPAESVYKTVDGRQPGSAHSASDMPAWGEVFAKASSSVGPENVKARIDALVAYLETLQAK